MTTRILGLDLGISSVGWAVVDTDKSLADTDTVHQLIDWGVRIFTPGVDGTDDEIMAGKGETRASIRRIKRAMRIGYQRRRKHKEDLTKALQKAGLLPMQLKPDFFVRVDQETLASLPQDDACRLAHVVPYVLRGMALDRELTPEQLGRALYHLGQRRGYKSNRKQALKENAEETGVVLNGIKELRDAMSQAGARTLGEYFAGLDPEQQRIRTRYTERSMFEDELHQICQAQRQYIDETTEREIHDAIFFQRKLKVNKSLVGACPLEPSEKRCSYSHQEAQEFRVLQTINDLRLTQDKGETVERALDASERMAVKHVLDGLTGALTKRGTVTLAALKRSIGLKGGYKITLAEGEKEVIGNQLNGLLYRAFGEAFTAMPEETRQAFLHDIGSIEKEDVLRMKLQRTWKLSEALAAELSHVSLPDGYCRFSLKALRNLLPGMREGQALNTVINKVYPEHYTASEKVYDELPYLDSVHIDLRNPLVHRVLTQMRLVVNAIIKKYGKPDFIHVELARDLKNGNKERQKITQKNRSRENEQKKIIEKIISEAGIEHPKHNDILKVKLAEECNWSCPYTGKHFNMTQLLHGGVVNIEHIVPRSRCMDDSYANKTLSMRDANMAKSNRLPYEAYGELEYNEILARVRHFKGDMARAKLDRFLQKDAELSDFISRNLNDTRYASKLAVQYLGLLYGGIVDSERIRRIQCSAGRCTALIRRAWGGNYLLGEGEKTREDHRHHAIDALTIAVTSQALVSFLAGMSEEQRRYLNQVKEPLATTELFQQAKKKLSEVGISHYIPRKMRGAFHDETLYSKPHHGIHHQRKPLCALEAKQVELIIDSKIRALVRERLEELGGDPQKVFKDETHLPLLRNRKGEVVNTIRCVRIAVRKDMRSIGVGDCRREVLTNGNYGMGVYSKLDKKHQEVGWVGETVSLLDAKMRTQRGEPVFPPELNGAPLKFTLFKGDIVQWTENGVENTCVVRGVFGQMFSCVAINEARPKKCLLQAKRWHENHLTWYYKRGAKKYGTTALGELRRVNG